MKRKKTRVKKIEASKTTPVPPAPPPVTEGNVFARFLHEAQSIGNEVVARRALQGEIAAFLAQKGLVAEFEAFREARKAPPA